MICVLTGGTGGAKFVDGLRQVMPAEEITLVVNTGDDLLWWGLYVSPDIDSITYVLSGMLSRERGWGVKGDTFLCLQAMGQLGEPTWFHTGDRDLAVPGIREALHGARGKIAAVSPIVGSAPVAGPAGILMAAQGLPCSIAGVAQAYEDFLDILVCDTRDARAADALRKSGLRVQC